MDFLLNIEAVTSHHNLKGLCGLYHFVETHVCTLTSLGVDSESYGRILASILLSERPQEVQFLVSCEIGEGEWNLDYMMRVIEGDVQACERMVSASTPTMEKLRKESPTAATLVTGHSGGLTYTYCQQAHISHFLWGCHASSY